MMWGRVMVTGHRPQHMTGEQSKFAIAETMRLASKVRDECGTVWGISGMAIGADQWWAESVLGAGLSLWTFIPFPQQADRWPAWERDIWLELREQADREVVLFDHYSVQNLHARNAAMVAAADAAIAIWSPSKTTGGTASAVRKIQAAGKPLVVVDLDQRRTYLKRATV